MRRLLATARCDVELQARNGLYFATGFVLLVMLALLAALPPTGVRRRARTPWKSFSRSVRM